MANSITSNPYIFDTASAACGWSGEAGVILMQWVDDNADIADNSNLIMSFNGITLEATIQRIASPDSAAVMWQIGPFARPFPVKDFLLTTMTAGNFLVFIQ